MFYHWLYPLREHSMVFNVFKYITFRSVGASITAFMVCLLLGPFVTRWLCRLSAVGTTEREHAGKIHPFYAHKSAVPTMGGLLIILGIAASALLWADWTNRLFLWCMGTLLWFGAIGFVDDYLKVTKRNTKGLRSWAKFLGQVAWGTLLALSLYRDPEFNGTVYIPFLKTAVLSLGFLYIPFAVFVLAGSSNALNLTDGLDGLAIGCMVFATGAFSVLSYVSGHAVFAKYLQIPFFSESGELTVFCAAMIGAGVGFLWYNAYPATIFMGDTGSLSLGGALGAVALCIKKELVLLIVGGIFVWEALSVILQVLSFKVRKKRIFLMSPYHHHLQMMGWPESKITVRFWIVAFILAIAGLSTLKLR